ncbi:MULTISPECIES: glycoside hydrolase family 32 protein [unclassified Gluconobacter]|uniref:glycoside hydrolase family 32 protein n=1 Tax=unclassified Gluconobacter TaxID=2644261 RepID=UPI001C04C108|nr:glycoside hydrolase family 32 protein [Gluconobacter sp. Gdi]
MSRYLLTDALPARLSRRSLMVSTAAALFGYSARALGKTGHSPPAYLLMSDPFRPQSHLLPPHGWMNDPCGPVFANNTYHLFYQWNPDAAVWGNMHWGHATSRDLVRWEHQVVALSPQPDGPDSSGVFTGDVVLDGQQAIAVYTGLKTGRAPDQVQCIATSDLTMTHWRQEAHPVLPVGPPGLKIRGFRDPKIWREGDTWVMLVGSSIENQGGVILRYEGRDLRDWSYKGIFYGPSDLRGGDDALECPDFFRVGARHALIFSINWVVHVVTGDYVNGKFRPLTLDALGYGNFYAARSMLDAQGRRTLFGWITEKPWQAGAAADRGWSGVMSFPRLLVTGPDGKVRSHLHPSVEALHGEILFSGSPKEPVTLPGPCVRIRVRFDANSAGELVFSRTDRFLHLDYNPQKTGAEVSCNEDTVPLSSSRSAELDIYVDASVIEIFTSDGSALNTRAYGDPGGPFTLKNSGCFQNADYEICLLKPVSGNRLTGIL